MEKILLNFSKFTDAAFEAKSQSIFHMMSGNVNFPNPVPDLEQFYTSVQAYQTALTKASGRDMVAVGIKNDKRVALTVLMVRLGNSVSFTANGNRTMLLSTGFDISKEHEPILIRNPLNMHVADGLNSGEAIASVKRVHGASSYVHEYSTVMPLEDTTWTSVTTTTRKMYFTNLTAGIQYWFRIGAVGPAGQLVYSNTVSRYIQ